MKGKQLVVLLVLLAVLGTAGFILQNAHDKTWSPSILSKDRKVLNLPVNDVASMGITMPDAAALHLTKKDGIWTVQERGNYPANFELVHTLLLKFWDLKNVQDVPVGASQYARLELVEPGKGAGSGTLVEFKDKDGAVLSSILLGKKYSRQTEASPTDLGAAGAGGRYVTSVGSAKVSLVSESLDEVNAKPEGWLRHDFIQIDGPKSIVMDGQTPGEHWKVTRPTAAGDWVLDGAKGDEKADSAKVGLVVNAVDVPNFVDVLAPGAKPEETGLDKPAVITFETFDNFVYTLKVGKAMGENYPVTVDVSANIVQERKPGADEKPEDKKKLDDEFKATLDRLNAKLAIEKSLAGRIFLVAKATAEGILKDRSALLVDKAPVTAPAAPSTPAAPGLGNPGLSHPPVSVATPPVSAPPVSVATPPVTVPPAAQPEPKLVPVPAQLPVLPHPPAAPQPVAIPPLPPAPAPVSPAPEAAAPVPVATVAPQPPVTPPAAPVPTAPEPVVSTPAPAPPVAPQPPVVPTVAPLPAAPAPTAPAPEAAVPVPAPAPPVAPQPPVIPTVAPLPVAPAPAAPAPEAAVPVPAPVPAEAPQPPVIPAVAPLPVAPAPAALAPAAPAPEAAAPSPAPAAEVPNVAPVVPPAPAATPSAEAATTPPVEVPAPAEAK